MANEITKLQRTQFSGMEYSTILADIKNAINDNPDFNKNWDNFVESDAGRMLIELFSWIADQLSTRIDWIANEGFISTATQRSSIIKLLKLIGYQLNLPKAAGVSVSCTPESVANTVIPLTVGFSSGNLEFSPFAISAKDNTGNASNYEALYYDTVNNKYDYTKNIGIDYTYDTSVTNLTKAIDFYEGQTVVESFVITTSNNQKYALAQTPVIANSVSVYYGDTLDELLKVNTFVDYSARTYQNLDGSYNAIPYVLNIGDNNNVTLEFAPSELLTSENRRPVYGKTVYVIYRVGGGTKGNIAERTINTTASVAVGADSVRVKFVNGTVGLGGEDQETIDHALFYGPAMIRTAKKTVTEEDYDLILSAYTNLLTSSSVGFNNINLGFYDKYGYYPNPLQVTNFVLLKKSGYDTINPSQYNDFKWADLKLENRFNENIAFNDGELNSVLDMYESAVTFLPESIDAFGDGNTRAYSNFIEVTSPSEFTSNIYTYNEELYLNQYNPNMVAGLTKAATTEKSVASIILPANSSNWYLLPEDDLGYIKPVDPVFGGLPKLSIEQECSAEWYSNKDLASGVTSATNAYQFSLKLDNRQFVNVVFAPDTTYTVDQIVEQMNDRIAEEYHGIDPDTMEPYPQAFGYQRVGCVKNIAGDGVDALWDGDEKILAPYFETITTSTPLGMKLRIYHTGGTYEDRIYNFNLDPDNNPFDPADDYQVFDSEVTPEENDYQSFLDIATILNRVLNYANVPTNGGIVSNVRVTLEASVPSEPDLGTCYDMFFRVNPDNPGDVIGVELLAFDSPASDCVRLLNGAQVAGLPPAKLYADYRNCVRAIHFSENDILKYYIKITSPIVGATESMIEFQDITNDWYQTLFNIDYKSSCYGIRRLSLITNQNITDHTMGNFIYEFNQYFIPSYLPNYDTYLYENGDIGYTNRLAYLSFIFSNTNKVLLGYTNNWYTPDTVEHVYNTILDEDRNVVNSQSSIVMKFTKEKVDQINSIYKITSDITVAQGIGNSVTTTNSDFASLVSTDVLYLAIDYTVGPPATSGADPSYWDTKLFGTSLNGITNITQLYDALKANFEANVDTYYALPFESYVSIYGDTLTIQCRNLDGKVCFYDNTGLTSKGAEKLFNVSFLAGYDYCETVSSGDYYLSYESAVGTLKKSVYINKISTSANFPDGDFYCHYINDRRYEIDPLTGEDAIIDEEAMESYLFPYKVIGVENVFAKPLFTTFDCSATISFDKSFSKADIQIALEKKVNEKYGEIKFGNYVSKSDLLATILDKTIPGITYATINYLGYNYTDQVNYPDVEKIDADFDEILVVRENEISSGTNNRGLIFRYVGV